MALIQNESITKSYLLQPRIQTFLVFLLSITLLYGLKTIFSEFKLDEIRFHPLSSDSLMQTLPLSILYEHPIRSLTYLHIDPPLFDAIRAMLASFWTSDKGSIGDYVDRHLLTLWLILFGILSTIIFSWVRQGTGSVLFAALVTLIWNLHPSPISMATNIDSTFMGSVFVTWLIYEIWIFGRPNSSVLRVVIATTLCFLTRSLFQWYFIPVLAVSLFFVGANKKHLTVGLCAITLIVGIFSIKQYVLFNTVVTSTFAGQSATGVLWITEANPRGGDTWTGYSPLPKYNKFISVYSDNIKVKYPEGASEISAGYNTEAQWRLHLIHPQIAKDKCRAEPLYCLSGLFRSIQTNWPQYWIETWPHENTLVANLPWTSYFYRGVHHYRLELLCAFLIFSIHTFRRTLPHLVSVLGKSLVPLYVFGICILGNWFDWYEGGRFKFFLEPSFFVFIVVQCFVAGRFLFPHARKLTLKFTAR